MPKVYIKYLLIKFVDDPVIGSMINNDEHCSHTEQFNKLGLFKQNACTYNYMLGLPALHNACK